MFRFVFFGFSSYHPTVRSNQARTLASGADDQLLTTGEAAQLLGVSRQHIVDLCDAGDLPHSLVGRHRRILRSDVEAIRTGRTRMSKQDTQSLLLAYAVAGEVVLHPESTLKKARHNLEVMKSLAHKGSTRVWLHEWDKLLSGPLLTLLQALTATSQRSRELRQNSPFAGVLSEEARHRALNLSTTTQSAP